MRSRAVNGTRFTFVTRNGGPRDTPVLPEGWRLPSYQEFVEISACTTVSVELVGSFGVVAENPDGMVLAVLK